MDKRDVAAEVDGMRDAIKLAMSIGAQVFIDPKKRIGVNFEKCPSNIGDESRKRLMELIAAHSYALSIELLEAHAHLNWPVARNMLEELKEAAWFGNHEESELMCQQLEAWCVQL